jgi:hypothetical protein
MQHVRAKNIPGGEVSVRDGGRMHKPRQVRMKQGVGWIGIVLIGLLSLATAAESNWESAGVLVLDISRSMQDNDPQNIRGDAEQTFIDLLSAVDGNQLGIIFFGAKARVMKPITTIQRRP